MASSRRGTRIFEADHRSSGRRNRAQEAYTAICGVEVEPGSHRIEIHYRPLTVRLGAFMLLLSVMGFCELAWWEGKGAPAPV